MHETDARAAAQLRYLALLRGLNVGGKNRVPMAQLREVFVRLGYTEVTTFIQSGNVIFGAETGVSHAALEAAVTDRFAIAIAVQLRQPAEVSRVVRDNPFVGADPAALHVAFLAARPPTDRLLGLDADRFPPDRCAVRGQEVYLHLPNGLGRSKLPAYLDRQLRVQSTVRNWNTVTALAELLGQ